MAKCKNPPPKVRKAGKDLQNPKSTKKEKSIAGVILKEHQDKNHK